MLLLQKESREQLILETKLKVLTLISQLRIGGFWVLETDHYDRWKILVQIL